MKIFLYGPPASGKSTLAKRLATALRIPAIDLDIEIERETGRKIPEIFANDGETAFRQIESATLRKTVETAGSDIIIALGGGTLLNEDNRRYAEENGIICCIDTPSDEELNRRIEAAGKSRPLGNKAKERAAHYASFPNRITATLDLENSLVIIGRNLPSPTELADHLIADTNAAAAHPEVVRADKTTLLPSGEEKKNLSTITAIWQSLNDHAIGRKNTIAAFGGGVTGDLTGFAAATWMRGIRWLNFPTTLLSMIDASTGGKTGCDLPIGKNLIGAFHSPQVVIIDTKRLETLPNEELLNGYAEMIKHEIISGKESLKITTENPIPDATAIADNLSVKVGIVREDPYETKGRRLLLNCGHTVAHALEIITDFAIPHGKAVAIGIAEEARLAVRLGLTTDEKIAPIIERLKSANLPTELPQGITYRSLISLMRGDKKREGNIVVFALPCAIGDVRATPVDLTSD